MLVILAPPVLAAFYQGTPSPFLSPVFGTLVNFDDKPTGTVIAWDDYVSVGVASVTETQGPWPLMRFGGGQSTPNYIGTGAAYGWDGTILIEFTSLANKVGIGIANSAGAHEVLNIYDSGHNLLESQTAPFGSNIYVYFERSSFDIKYFEIVGDFFAVDDLQFTSQPPTASNLKYLHSTGGLFNLTEPLGTQWHELWPIFCREYHLSSWNDTSGDGVLSHCDWIDMYEKPNGEVKPYHVEEVTITLNVTHNETQETMYIELEGGYNASVLMNPIDTQWHEIHPVFCTQYQLSGLEWHCGPPLGYSDYIWLLNKETRVETKWHVEEVAIDIIVTPEPPPVGGEVYPVSKASLLAPWIAGAVVLAGGAIWYVSRRRRAQN
jgi:hypothetical protein